MTTDQRIDMADSGSPVRTNLDSLQLPSPDKLQELLALAQRGRIRQLTEQLEQLLESNECYGPFSEPLLVLASQFELEAIETKLEQFLTQIG